MPKTMPVEIELTQEEHELICDVAAEQCMSVETFMQNATRDLTGVPRRIEIGAA